MNKINSQNVTITSREFQHEIKKRSLVNYLDKKPLLKAGSMTIAIPLLTLSKVGSLGYYAGEKFSHYLLVAGGFAVDKFIETATNIYQVFSKQPEQRQSIKQYNCYLDN